MKPIPSNPQADRIRAAVEKNSRKMTLQLARDLGVPEVEVIRVNGGERGRHFGGAMGTGAP